MMSVYDQKHWICGVQVESFVGNAAMKEYRAGEALKAKEANGTMLVPAMAEKDIPVPPRTRVCSKGDADNEHT